MNKLLCRCTGWGGCLATPEKPCFCPCHRRKKDDDGKYILSAKCDVGRCKCKNKSKEAKDIND